jgi:aspartyl aminopeptidase
MQGKAVAQGFLEFVNESVTSFHAVSVSKRILSDSGFEEIAEHQPWALKPGNRYFFTRNQSSIFAFIVGKDFTPEEGAFRIIGTHTDSPCPKLAPNSKISSGGFIKLNVMLYGGGLWNSWFDRDLTLAGRVVLNQGERLETRLLHIKRPILSLPELAIHLSSNREKFEYNKETHLKPILCSLLLENKSHPEGSKKHPTGLLHLIAQELECEIENISDLELHVVDTNPAQITGLYQEFISSPRLDNLMSCYCALQALSESTSDGKDIKLWAGYDNEEVGSVSITGADSIITLNALNRILSVLHPSLSTDLKQVILRKSFALSADMAHAIHPNFSDKHHPQHAPKMHEGVVIKINANQKYATDFVGSGIIKALASRNSIPFQEFIVKNDSPCGATIGTMLAANTGIRVVDVGAPQFAMHSCREIMGTDDAYYYYSFMKSFYDDGHSLNDSGSYY